MLVIHFGRITAEGESRSFGEFALHVDCPWRIEGPEGIVTGRMDLWEPTNQAEDFDWEEENLQDSRLETLLGSYEPKTGSFVNESERLIVDAIDADDYGGAVIALSGGYRLVLFPAGSVGEDWRLFEYTSKQRHFVISGGKVETPGEPG